MSVVNQGDKRGNLDNALTYIDNEALFVGRRIAIKVAYELNREGSQQPFMRRDVDVIHFLI